MRCLVTIDSIDYAPAVRSSLPKEPQRFLRICAGALRAVSWRVSVIASHVRASIAIYCAASPQATCEGEARPPNSFRSSHEEDRWHHAVEALAGIARDSLFARCDRRDCPGADVSSGAHRLRVEP